MKRIPMSMAPIVATRPSSMTAIPIISTTDICTMFTETTHQPDHVHGPGCGHPAVPHGNHVDYLVQGHLHHPHGTHCDDHGKLAAA